MNKLKKFEKQKTGVKLRVMQSTDTISRSVKAFLQLTGSWPDVPYSWLLKFFWMTTVAIVLIFQYRYLLGHIDPKYMLQCMDCLSVTLSYTLFFLELIITWLNERALRDILETMAKDREKYTDPDSNDLFTRTAYLSRLLTNTIIGMFSVCVVLYAFGFVTQLEGDVPISSRDNLLRMHLPIEINSSLAYKIMLLVQFIHEVTSSSALGSITALILMMTLHAACKIDIICRKLSKISPSDTNQLRFLIVGHQEIIIFVENMNKIFKNIALMQFISNILISCCLGFLMVISLGMENGVVMIAKCVLFYVVITGEAFVFCFAGEYISAKSRQIGNAAYESLWYNLNSKKIQILLIVMLRSQKDLTISVGKFMNLSLECFMVIMKASASYISVLLAMY